MPEIVIDIKGLQDLSAAGKVAALRDGLEAVTGKGGADVQAGAMARSRVDTGTMRAGWTHKIESGPDSVIATVSNGVDYTIHNEFGTWKMAAQPMAIPALDEVTPGYVAAVETVVERVL